MSAASDQRWVGRIQACWDADQDDYRANYRDSSVARGYPENYLDADRPTAEQCLAALARVRRSTATTHPIDVAARTATQQVDFEQRLRVVISRPDPKWDRRAITHPDEWHVASYVGHFHLAKTPNGWVLTDVRDETRTAGPFTTKAAVVQHLKDRTAVRVDADLARAGLEAASQRELGQRLVHKLDTDPDGFVEDLLSGLLQR